MGSSDYLEFTIPQVEDIASETMKHQAQWDEIWNNVKGQISRTISADLDAYTGSSLDERSAEYHAKTAQYTQQLQAQSSATSKVGGIAADMNLAMAKAVAAR